MHSCTTRGTILQDSQQPYRLTTAQCTVHHLLTGRLSKGPRSQLPCPAVKAWPLDRQNFSVDAELSGGAFKACRFARDAQKGLFTVVNHQGSGYLLYWQQNELGEMTLVRQTKANSFAAPITAFDISPRGNFLGTGTSEGMCCHPMSVACSCCVPCLLLCRLE